MSDDQEMEKMVVVEEKYCYKEQRDLTVHKKSMFSHGDGFTAYDSRGEIVFRVDLYGKLKYHPLLMDAVGKTLLTLLPKRPTLHHRWEGFLGEKLYDQQLQQQNPIFSIWRTTIIGPSNITVEVHKGNSPSTFYQIEGSFYERSCTILRSSKQPDHDTSREWMAQIKRKIAPTKKVLLDRDVFSLILKPGFDAAFAMALVLALDRIDGDDFAFC